MSALAKSTKTNGVLSKWGNDLRQSYRTLTQAAGVSELDVHLLRWTFALISREIRVPVRGGGRNFVGPLRIGAEQLLTQSPRAEAFGRGCHSQAWGSGTIFAPRRYQVIMTESLSLTLAAMGNNRRNHHDREAELVREVDRLRSLLSQAGIDAEQSLRETEASERRRVRDVTEERARTQSARADVDEIRHRLKNTLAVVQAIANATLDPDVPMVDARTAFNSRLEALARAHDILFQSNWANADLRTIIDGILAPYTRRGQNRIRAKGPKVTLDAKPALAFALALQELGTNAAKYGALSNDEGHIEIAWTVTPHLQGREFRLRWRERNGPPVLPPSHTGLGTRLIQRNLAAEFGGEVELAFQRDGVECMICAPAEGLGLTEPQLD